MPSQREVHRASIAPMYMYMFFRSIPAHLTVLLPLAPQQQPSKMPTTVHLFLSFLFVPLHLATAMTHSTPDPNGAAHDLLPQFGLPKGLLPGNVVRYTKSDDGRFTVELSEPCYTQFSELAYYEKTITGKISYGLISGLSGIQVRKFFVWFSIARVEAGNGDGTILFDTGRVSEKHPASEFRDIHPCKNAVADT